MGVPGAFLGSGVALPYYARPELAQPDQEDFADQPAGSTILLPVPDGRVSLIEYGFWVITTSAALGNRSPFIACVDSDGMEMWRAPAPSSIGPGVTTRITLQVSGANGSTVGTMQTMGIPYSACWPGMAYRFDAEGWQAGDITNELHVRRVLIPLGPALDPEPPPVAPLRLT